MPGNSSNRSKRVTSKKGATAGSGGKNRSSLKGKGKTLPADERPWHKGYSGTEKLPSKTAWKQDKERKAAAAEGRAPKIGDPAALAARPVPGSLRAAAPTQAGTAPSCS
jgi:23S rRNA (guanosine2251-2'-O)-methyltransferase